MAGRYTIDFDPSVYVLKHGYYRGKLFDVRHNKIWFVVNSSPYDQRVCYIPTGTPSRCTAACEQQNDAGEYLDCSHRDIITAIHCLEIPE